jgi:sulfonate transport system permease protein
MRIVPARKHIVGAAGIGAALGLWLLLSWDSTSIYFPPLREMIPRALSYWSSAQGSGELLSTLCNLIRGFAVGAVAGMAIGLLVGQVKTLDLALAPMFEFLRSIPNVALLPAAVAIFGIGNGMAIFSIALATAWPVLLNTIDGSRQIPDQWKDTGVVYGLTGLQQQLNVVIPALMPRILAGLHVAIPLSLVVSVTSEMVGGGAVGIGSVIMNAQYTYEVDLMWSGILILGVVGLLLNVLFYAMERPLRSWNSVAHEEW